MTNGENIIDNITSVGGKDFAIISVDDLTVDMGYQRKIKSKIKKMTNNWNYQLCDVIIVSYRDGKFYVVDGQHRLEAARRQTIDPRKKLVCQVIQGLTREEEAARFIALNTSQSFASPHDTWNANLLLGDKVDTAIDRICKKWEIEVSDRTGNTLKARLGDLSEARSIIRNQGEFTFDWILSVLHEAQWNLVRGGHSSLILRALRTVYKENWLCNKQAIKDAAVEVLKGRTPLTLRADAIHKYCQYDAKGAVTKYLLDNIRKNMMVEVEENAG